MVREAEPQAAGGRTPDTKRRSLFIPIGVEVDAKLAGEIVRKVGGIRRGATVGRADYYHETEQPHLDAVREKLAEGNFEHATVVFHREGGHYLYAPLMSIAALAGESGIGLDAVMLDGGYAGHRDHPYTITTYNWPRRIRE